jgi:hypothetical protein
MYRLTAQGVAFAREQLAEGREAMCVIRPARASS